MSETIVKPEVGKPFAFEMSVDLDGLVECGGMDALNDMMDNEFWDRFGDGLLLSDISYKPIRINDDSTIVIEVTAQDVERTDGEE
jgi:hypothetical protein